MIQINNIIITGTLTKDPIFKNMGDYNIINLSIAYNKSIMKNNEWTQETSFFNATSFSKYIKEGQFKKGDNVILEGSIKQEHWEKEGEARSRVVIMAKKVYKLNKKNIEENKVDEDIQEQDIPF